MVLKKSLKNGLKIAERANDDKGKFEQLVKRNSDGEQKQKRNDNEREESEDEEATTEVESEYEAPDGGWGWMVTIGMTIVCVTTMGPNASFTMIFGDFFEATGQAGSVTTMLNSLFNISYSVAGLLTNPLLKQFSMRTIGVIGAILYGVSNVLLTIVNHVIEIALLFFLEGIGLGLIYTICSTNFNAYFDKRRSMVMGISQVVVGLGGIIYPIVIELMMEEYGCKGTILIIGALSLNCISAMALMRPPSIWKAQFRKKKSKDIKETDETKKPLVAVNSLTTPRQIEKIKRNEKWNSCRSLQENTDSDKEVKLMPEVRVASVSNVETGIHRGRSKSLLVSGIPSDWSKSRTNILLAGFTSSSLTNLRVQPAAEALNNAVMHMRPPPAAINEDESEVDVSPKRKRMFRFRNRAIFENLIDFSLLKSWSFLNMCFGISFACTSDFTFASFMPMMMAQRGFTKTDIALTITVSASAELVSRICLAVFTIFVDARPKLIFFVAMIGMSLAKIGYLYLEDTLTGTIIMVAAIGTARSWLLVPQPLVVVENVSADQFAAAYGVFSIVGGAISVVFGPFAGLVKDWTDSFLVCQIVLLVMNSLFIVPWAVELTMDYRKAKSAR